MFTAYGFVHYSLYGAYEKYAFLVPGSVEAAFQACYLLSSFDVDARGFNETFRVVCASSAYGIVQEYRVFCVRAADGVNFDVYLVDEDQLFLSSVAGVAGDDVVVAGFRLMENWRNFEPVLFQPDCD